MAKNRNQKAAKVASEFAPFQELVDRVVRDKIPRWTEIEAEFIRVVGLFDAEFATGTRDSGWYQCKARYFNDLIVQLLVNLSGKPIASRCKRSSRLFDLIDIDICYPESGTPMIAGEVKALGTPPHPKNKNKARAGRSDLHKRVREVALTAVDFKAAYALPVPISSLQEWIDKTSPGYFSFWAVRVANDKDLSRVRGTLTSLRNYCNGVAAVVYQADRSPTEYSVVKLSELSIDRAVHEMAQRIA